MILRLIGQAKLANFCLVDVIHIIKNLILAPHRPNKCIRRGPGSAMHGPDRGKGNLASFHDHGAHIVSFSHKMENALILW